jgi:hypothetical protein
MNGTHNAIAAHAEAAPTPSAGTMTAALPTAEEVKVFAEAMAAARERFVRAALAEDGMPVSAGRVVTEDEPVRAG